MHGARDAISGRGGHRANSGMNLERHLQPLIDVERKLLLATHTHLGSFNHPKCFFTLLHSTTPRAKAVVAHLDNVVFHHPHECEEYFPLRKLLAIRDLKRP